MSTVDLLAPILDGGLRRNNFFNGRLLSAEDLTAEQDANRTQQRRLARALGGGVAWGLNVSVLSSGPANPQLQVQPGAALNRCGDLLYLAQAAQVTLVPSTTAVQVAEGVFADCGIPSTAATYAGDGAYVLAISPMAGYEGTAEVSDPNATAVGRGACGARFTVEGVQFRLVPVDFDRLAIDASAVIPLLPPATVKAREQLRSALAHLCFGSVALRDYFKDPLARTAAGKPEWDGWGLLDALRDNHDLANCDVPLAVVVMTSAGISFADTWSARRHLVDAGAIHGWLGVAGPRRVAEAQAAFLQFQHQLAELPASVVGPSTKAGDYFFMLPAAGRLPVGGAGLSWPTFLGVHAPPEVTRIDQGLLRGVVEESWLDDPFPAAGNDPVPLHVYQVPEQTGYVVFARSRLGQIRVRLSPALPAGSRPKATATATAGGTRVSTATSSDVLITDVAPGHHTVHPELDNYQPTPSHREVDVVAGRTTDALFTMTALGGTVLVKMVDRITSKAIASQGNVWAYRDGQRLKAGVFTANGQWRLSGLPAGRYEVRGSAPGYVTASSNVDLPATGEVTVRLELLRTRAGKQPDRCLEHFQAREPALGQVTLCMVVAASEFETDYHEKQIRNKLGVRQSEFRIEGRSESRNRWSAQRFVADTDEIVYTSPAWKNFVVLKPESAELQQWLQDWGQYLGEAFDDERIRKLTPRVYVDPHYQFAKTKAMVPTSPVAYAVYETFGVPVLIKPETDSGRTKGPVGLGEASVPGLTREKQKVFEDKRLWRIDDLLVLPREILTDILGDPPDDTGYLVEDVGREVERINQQRAYYPGLTEAQDQALTEAGYTTDVGLANADRADLARILGSASFAVRVLQTARSLVGQEAWSLESLGLTEEQGRQLEERGMDSKGAVARGATEDAGKAALAEVLGVAEAEAATRDAAVATMAVAATSQMVQASVEARAVATVQAWMGADQVTGAILTRAGYLTVADLAGASAEEVVGKTGLAQADAERLIGDARAATPGGQDVGAVAGLSATERTELNKLAGGTATLNFLAGKSPAEVAGAFGGDVARATAFLGAVRTGLQNTAIR